MGFRMKIIIAIVTLLSVACIKAPKLNHGLGPQASDAQLEQAISKALDGVDPFGTSVGQQVIYYVNMRIQNQDQIDPIAQITQTVMSLTVTSQPVQNNLDQQTIEIV